MTDKKKLYSEHITAAKDWLGKAEESIAKDNDIRSDLNIMLAQAELQRAKEKDDTALIRKRLKWILPWITAIGIAVGYVYFLRPELFTTVREESPAVTVVKEENVPAKENIIQTDTDDKAEIPLQNENNAVKPIDNTERVNVPETAVTEKIEGTYRERIEDKNDTVQEAETEKSSLPEKDIQKMIQSAGKILRD
ncbi:MAG: hypothetical protein MSA77_01160 [Selenomonadales bacterium]|nr:hypothetical protein [Selenomonadales bacterium]MEE1362774.1 hypothetical protein [Selenomonadaceae bacterium]